MTIGSIKGSLCLGAVGQVGGLFGGFISVMIASVISPRNFFDSPIRIAVFTTACGLIGGIAAFSASFSLAVSKRLVFSIPVAMAASFSLCAVLKLILSSAGQDSPVGKLFTLVCAIISVCQTLACRKAKVREAKKRSGAPSEQVPPRPAIPRTLAAAGRVGAGTALAIFGVLMIAFAGIPVVDTSEIGPWSIVLYVLLGFMLGAVMPLGEHICSMSRRPDSG